MMASLGKFIDNAGSFLKRKAKTLALSTMLGFNLAACDTKGDSTPGPGTEPGTKPDPISNVKEIVKAPVQYVDISPDSTITVSNFGSADAVVMKISLKKSDIGKGVPVDYTYTGQPMESAISAKDVMTGNAVRLTTTSESAFDMSVSRFDKKVFLNNDNASYKSFGISKVYTNKISILGESNIDKATNVVAVFMKTGQTFKGTLLEISGKGVPNQAIISSIVYKVQN